jgi:hypothetical protein
MIQLIVPIVLGFLLLSILLYWFLLGNPSSKAKSDLCEAREALIRLQMLPISLVDRVLDPNDLQFVRSEKDPMILSMFESERKIIAICWLHQLRRQVVLLMRSHVRAVRSNARLSPAIETKLAFDYFEFLLTYQFLLGLMWMSGPFEARRLAGSVTHSVTRLCQTSERLLAPSVSRPGSVTAIPGDRASGRG